MSPTPVLLPPGPAASPQGGAAPVRADASGAGSAGQDADAAFGDVLDKVVAEETSALGDTRQRDVPAQEGADGADASGSEADVAETAAAAAVTSPLILAALTAVAPTDGAPGQVAEGVQTGAVAGGQPAVVQTSESVVDAMVAEGETPTASAPAVPAGAADDAPAEIAPNIRPLSTMPEQAAPAAAAAAAAGTPQKKDGTPTLAEAGTDAVSGDGVLDGDVPTATSGATTGRPAAEQAGADAGTGTVPDGAEPLTDLDAPEVQAAAQPVDGAGTSGGSEQATPLPPPVSEAPTAGAAAAAAAPAEDGDQVQATLATSATPTGQRTLTERPGGPAAQIATAVAALRRQGDGTFNATVDLHPAELGRVRVVLNVQGSLVDVAVTAEQASTRQLLNAELNQLREALQGGGLDAGSLDVREHGFGAGDGTGEGDGDGRGGPGAGGGTDEGRAVPRGHDLGRLRLSVPDSAGGTTRLDMLV